MGEAHTDLAFAKWAAHIKKWAAHINRRFDLDALFANHDVLMTGRIALPNVRAMIRDPLRRV